MRNGTIGKVWKGACWGGQYNCENYGKEIGGGQSGVGNLGGIRVFEAFMKRKERFVPRFQVII